MTKDDLVSEYLKSGYRCLGNGLYSCVYARRDADWCIKVGSANDGYLAYLQFAITNGWIGTHAPYIYSIKALDGGYIATMERLAMTFGQSWGTPIWEHAKAQRRSIEWGKRLDALINEVANRYRGLGPDYHEGNWMLRRSGELVLIDPLQGRTQTPVITHWRNPNPRPTITPHPLLG